MNERRRGLGRGLGALLPTGPYPADRGADGGVTTSPVDVLIPERVQPGPGWPEHVDVSGPESKPAAAATVPTDVRQLDEPAASSEAYFAEVPLDSIAANPRQPRQHFDEEALEELVHSIRQVGLLQPVVLRPLGNERFELVMGERRWRAAQRAGLSLLPAIVRPTAAADRLRDALLENLHRSDLTPLEEAAAYDQLLEDFSCTHEELATRLGRSRPQITNTLRLLKLSPQVQRRVAAGVLSAGHARALLALPDEERQDLLAQRIVAEGLSVRAVEELVAVGGETPATRRRRGARLTAPGLDDISQRLADRFETRVSVELGRRRGKIVVEFASLDDLDRILGLLDPAHHARPADVAPAVSRETSAAAG